MQLRDCWTIVPSGDFEQGYLEIQDNSIVLRSSRGQARNLGPYSEAAQRAVDCLPQAQYSGLNYFRDHARLRKSFAALTVEMLDECEWHCATCIAASAPGKGKVKTKPTLLNELDAATKENFCDTIFLSGGEPTIHPNALEICQASANSNKSIFLITNGRRIAEDIEFTKKLGELCPHIHVYLQYDSFRDQDLQFIRGQKLSILREKAISQLENFGINYTLVCVVMRGVNDDILGEIISRNLSLPNCRGVTFQPVKFMGRHLNANAADNHITAFDVAEKINSKDFLSNKYLEPHPLNPMNWHIRYFTDSGAPIENSDIGNLNSLYLPREHEQRRKRVAVIWHTDIDNFVAESVCAFPQAIISDSNVLPMMIHYK